MKVTREQVMDEMKKYKNKGKGKIKNELRKVLKTYPEMTTEDVERIIDDLESYRDYKNEK